MPLELTWLSFKTRLHVQVRAYELCTLHACFYFGFRTIMNSGFLHGIHLQWCHFLCCSLVARAGYSKPSASFVPYLSISPLLPTDRKLDLFDNMSADVSNLFWKPQTGSMRRMDLSFSKRRMAIAPNALKNIARSDQLRNAVVGKTVLYSCLRCVVHWENHWVSMGNESARSCQIRHGMSGQLRGQPIPKSWRGPVFQFQGETIEKKHSTTKQWLFRPQLMALKRLIWENSGIVLAERQFAQECAISNPWVSVRTIQM